MASQGSSAASLDLVNALGVERLAALSTHAPSIADSPTTSPSPDPTRRQSPSLSPHQSPGKSSPSKRGTPRTASASPRAGRTLRTSLSPNKHGRASPSRSPTPQDATTPSPRRAGSPSGSSSSNSSAKQRGASPQSSNSSKTSTGTRGLRRGVTHEPHGRVADRIKSFEQPKCVCACVLGRALLCPGPISVAVPVSVPVPVPVSVSVSVGSNLVLSCEKLWIVVFPSNPFSFPRRPGPGRRKCQPSARSVSTTDPTITRLQHVRSASATAVSNRHQDQKLAARLGEGEYSSSTDSMISNPAAAPLSHASVGQLRSVEVNGRTRHGSPHSKAIRKTGHKLAISSARLETKTARGRPTSISPQRSSNDSADKRSPHDKVDKADKRSPRDKVDKADKRSPRDKLGPWEAKGTAEQRKTARGERMQAARQAYKHVGGNKGD